MALAYWLLGVLIYGTGGIRTLDLPLRRRSLYPAELQPQVQGDYSKSRSRAVALTFLSENRCNGIYCDSGFS